MTTPEVENLTPDVRTAVADIAAAYPQVSLEPDGDGGAYVVVEAVPLSQTYQQSQTWVGFHITYAYPRADVYPHFVRSDLCRVDGGALGGGTSAGHSFRGRAAVQLSRRSNRLNPAVDTALLKLQKVLRWLNSS